MKMKLGKIAKYAFLIIASFFSVFPLFWMLVSATNESVDVIRGTLMFGGSVAANYQNLLSNQDLWGAFRNSAINALSVTLLSLFVCSLAGYGFEVFHTKAKDTVMSILLIAIMIPFAATLVPLFQMFSGMGLLSNIIAVILPTVSTPLIIMMFRQSARSFPRELIEAARMDGLSEPGIFFRVFFPTMKSTYAAAMTIVFMNAWNNYLWPKVILQDGKTLTMPMLVANLIAGYVTDYGMLMLAVTIASLPTIIVFFLLQKSFTEGIVGAVK